MGTPMQSSAPLGAWAKGDPQRAKVQIVDAGVPDFAKSLLAGIKPGRVCPACERPAINISALRLFARIAGWVGADTTIVLAIWNQLGVRDEAEARSLIQVARSTDGLDPDATYAMCLAYCREAALKRGERIEVVRDAAGKGEVQPNGGKP